MKRDLERLANESFDLLVIGGGINGLAAAWDAALRGLRVALVEKGDFGAQTSSATLKIVHGGLRYLQHLDFRRMRESIGERSVMLRIAPHLVEPFPFLVPTYGHFMQGKELMAAAILMNEIMSFDRNRDIHDPARRIPAGRLVSRDECLKLAPCIQRERLTGGVIFYDAQMYNSERLTLSFALSAAEQGAALANYAQVTALQRKADRVVGARVRDELTGAEFEVRAAVTANMTGPWADIILGLLNRPDPPRRVLRSKGIQIVAPRLTDGIALAVPSKYEDPDAIIKRGGRNFFITPWRGVSLIGTTDTVYEGDPDAFRILDGDIRDFVAEINESLPAVQLSREQVPFAFGGLRPITEKNIDAGSKVARKYEIYDHRRDLGIEGLVTVIGVKYTTCRLLAEKVVNLVCRKLGGTWSPVCTREKPLVGGDLNDFEALLREAVDQAGVAQMDERVMLHLVRNYGTYYRRFVDWAKRDPDAGRRLTGSNEVIWAEVLHAVREELAVHLSDIVFRRTDLGTLGPPARAALRESAELAGRELGWTAAQIQSEMDQVMETYKYP
jgi:glycerol-3-phosphate dehydrogenase